MRAARDHLKMARKAKDAGNHREARSRVQSAKNAAVKAIPAKERSQRLRVEANNFRQYLKETHKGNPNPWAYD